MSSVAPGLSIDARRHFLHALRRVLRPIIRLLIRNGIRYDEFADVARGAYVESAVRGGIDRIANPTRDQVALITGIPRQRVDHYIDDEDALPRADATSTRVMTEVLHRWHTDPKYLGPEGAPLELDLDVPSEPSFQSLVAQVNAEANPAFVLEELLRARSVTYANDRRIRAITRCFIWQAGSLSSIEYFGETLAGLASTLEYNLNPNNAKNKRLERSVFTDRGLSKKHLGEFQEFSKDRTNQFLLELDDWLARFSDTTKNQADSRVKAGVDVFSYAEIQQDARPLSTLVRSRRASVSSDEAPSASS